MPLLGRTEVAVGGLDQPGEQALHVLADVPGFGQAGRIADDQRDIQVGSQTADEVGLPRTRGTDQEDVGLLDSHIVQVGVGDDRIGSASIPGIDESLEVVA